MTIKNVLITGHTGNIGQVLTSGLAPQFTLYGLDIDAGDSANLKKTFIADISDYDALANAFRQMGPVDAIVHLAGDPSVGASWESVLKNNIIGTRNVYEAAREFGVRRVVFASSNHVTGAYEGIPPKLHEQDEYEVVSVDDPIRPDSYYGTGKAFGEALARQYYELHGLQSICLRIGSLLGDDDPTRGGRSRRTWLSHRDCVQLVRLSLLAEVEFGIYYGVSDNDGRYWDITNARRELGYAPQDNGAKR
jgi:nucleoside-diphosphate-sugar epimerase